MKQESTVDLLLDVDQRPSAGKGILLSFQHVFAMFGFKAADFLQTPEEEKTVPRVDFNGLGD